MIRFDTEALWGSLFACYQGLIEQCDGGLGKKQVLSVREEEGVEKQCMVISKIINIISDMI